MATEHVLPLLGPRVSRPGPFAFGPPAPCARAALRAMRPACAALRSQPGGNGVELRHHGVFDLGGKGL